MTSATRQLYLAAVGFFAVATIVLFMEASVDRSPTPFPHGYSSSSSPSSTTAFVIRTNQFEGMRKERILEWIRSFEGTNIDPWLLIHSDDEISEQNNVTRKLERFFLIEQQARNLQIRYLSTEDLLRTFPMLQVNMLTPSRWGWALQHVCFQYWWMNLPGKKTYDNAWIIEDDTAFVGKMNEFVDHYASRQSDLIVHRLAKKNTTWFWYNATSQPFADMIPDTRRYFAADHIQRWSSRYLSKSVEFTQKNIAATSEQAVATLAFWSGFDVSLLDDQHTIDAFFHSGSKVNESTWQQMLNSSEFQNKLVHAVKF